MPPPTVTPRGSPAKIAGAAAGAASTEPSTGAAAASAGQAAQSTLVVTPKAKGKKGKGGPRGPRPRLDFDLEIDAISARAKDAKKVLQAHMAEKRNAARRKSRLVKKASKLPTDDLYRIAVLKRVGQLDLLLGSATAQIKAPVMSEEQKETVVKRLRTIIDAESGGLASIPGESEEKEMASSASTGPEHGPDQPEDARRDAMNIEDEGPADTTKTGDDVDPTAVATDDDSQDDGDADEEQSQSQPGID